MNIDIVDLCIFLDTYDIPKAEANLKQRARIVLKYVEAWDNLPKLIRLMNISIGNFQKTHGTELHKDVIDSVRKKTSRFD